MILSLYPDTIAFPSAEMPPNKKREGKEHWGDEERGGKGQSSLLHSSNAQQTSNREDTRKIKAGERRGSLYSHTHKMLHKEQRGEEEKYEGKGEQSFFLTLLKYSFPHSPQIFPNKQETKGGSLEGRRGGSFSSKAPQMLPKKQ